jgi:hypothetical protein
MKSGVNMRGLPLDSRGAARENNLSFEGTAAR